MLDTAPAPSEITLRRLPEGESRKGVARGWDGRRVRVDLPSDSPASDLQPGALVEIEAPERLYLGEVETCQGRSLTVLVEHALQRQALSEIQDVWR